MEKVLFGMGAALTRRLDKKEGWGRDYAEGKKIGWKDGLTAIYWIIKYNLFRKGPKELSV